MDPNILEYSQFILCDLSFWLNLVMSRPDFIEGEQTRLTLVGMCLG